MPDLKISELPQESAPARDDSIVVVDKSTGTNKKVGLGAAADLGGTSRGAGDGLVLDGNDLDVNPGDGLEIASDKVKVKQGTGITVDSSGVSVENPFTDADETHLDSIEAGAQKNAPHLTRAAVVTGDAVSLGASLVQFSDNGTALQTGNAWTSADSIRIADHAATFGTSPPALDVDLDAVSLVPFLEDRLDGGAFILLINRGNDSAFVQVKTVQAVTAGSNKGYILSNLSWIDVSSGFTHTAGVAYNLVFSDGDVAADSFIGKMPASKVSGLAAVATSGDYDDLSDKPTIPDVSSHVVEAEFEAALDVLFNEEISRTFTLQASATHGEAIVSVDNNQTFGSTTFLYIDYRKGSDDDTDLIDGVQAGDFVLLQVGTAKVIMAKVAGVDFPPNDTNGKRIWLGTELYTRGLNNYGEIGSGAGTISFKREPGSIFARLDASNLTPRFKDAVRSPSDPYTFAGAYERLSDGGNVAEESKFALSNAPTLNGAAVQLTIQFASTDLASATERWFTGNEFVFGTMRFRIAGFAVVLDKANRRYQASVVWIEGANQTGSATPKIEPDTPHRSELSTVAFSGDYDDLTDKPTIPTPRGAGDGLTLDGNDLEVTVVEVGEDTAISNDPSWDDLLTGLATDDMIAITFESAWSSETNNVTLRTVVIKFGHLSTSTRWVDIRGGAGGARMQIRRNSDKVQVNYAGAIDSANAKAWCYKLPFKTGS